MSFKFENLLVWQKAIDVSYDINMLVSHFPKEEVYVLSSQLKRAADSISLNIAEGSTGQSNAGFARFLNYSIRSAIEVVSGLFLARKRNLINEDEFKVNYEKIELLVKMLQSLKNSLEGS
ncbi:MAG TPA: four helix bundle protein [Tenuifilaceae bacterium]|nr:four helix bundle protein [Tenuifilaceae bacterium]HOZ15861.1 four helix bundle protein [Tenuifilaceae bacterium]HPI44422.1 four helix bundle protein [Tenuifilaceae bacterium]HPN21695.1 four helix bundle protein [Tenuifilaceae bacterium]